jgi:hypothetical protein
MKKSREGLQNCLVDNKRKKQEAMLGCGCRSSNILRVTAEKNLKIRNKVGELKDVILRMKIVKKLHKTEMKQGQKRCSFRFCVVCLHFVCTGRYLC